MERHSLLGWMDTLVSRKPEKQKANPKKKGG